MVPVPAGLEQDRDDLLEAIDRAFSGVARNGGVSWSQADVLDGAYTPESYATAGLLDTEERWQELIEAKMFVGCPANWSFLDAIGFRYYLPACMSTYLRCGEDGGCLSSSLDLTYPEWQDNLRRHSLDQWSLLDIAQCNCVARFIRFMSSWEHAVSPPDRWFDTWQQAYHAHWKAFDDPQQE